MSIGAIQPPATRPAMAGGGRVAPVERVIEGEVIGGRGAQPPPFGDSARPSFAPGDPRRAIAAYVEQANPVAPDRGARIDFYV